MAITNHDRVGKAMELLKGGLGLFVERELKSTGKGQTPAELQRYLGDDRPNAKKAVVQMDVAALLKIMWESWNDVFRLTLGPAERSLVSELRDHRNRWAHQEIFSGDDAYRALDSACRLLTAISSPLADDIERMKTELLRIRFDEQARNEKRKSAGTAIEGAAAGGLKPWRSGDAAQGCHQRSLSAGRVRRGPLAGARWRGDGRVQESRRVFSPHVSHREPQGDAGRRGATSGRSGRRSGRAAPDQLRRLQDLDEAARKYLAWESILDEKVVLNLTPQQVKQAETQRVAADSAVTARIPEVYQWLLVPVQKSPQEAIEWQALRLPSGQDALAVRASKKLRNDELLLTGFAGTRLKMELDRVPLWRINHVAVKQLAEDFARYVYLPRLKDSAVLVGAVRDGLGLLTWEEESFAFADSFDEATGRYRGLRGGQLVSLVEVDSPGLLVKGAVARSQLAAESENVKVDERPDARVGGDDGSTTQASGTATSVSSKNPAEPPKRFHGTVALDATRVGRDAGRVAEEVIAHLTGLVGAKVTVTLEAEAQIPSGASEQVVRIVTENSRALKFTSQGFEKE
jgi:Swt1-like HEPN